MERREFSYESFLQHALKKINNLLFGNYLFYIYLIYNNTDNYVRVLINKMDDFMKNILILMISSMCCLFAAQQGFSDEAHSQVLATNVEYAKSNIVKKMERLTARLEKYRSQMENCQDEEQTACLSKKIAKAEKKLKNLKEVLLSLEVAESKISK